MLPENSDSARSKNYKVSKNSGISTFILGDMFVGIRSVGTGGVFTDSLLSAWPGSLFSWFTNGV